MWPRPIVIVIGLPCQRPKVAMGEKCSHLPAATMNLKICNFLLVNFQSNWYFCKEFKRLTVKGNNLPTPTKLNRVNKFLSSIVDSCLFGTVRIFNIFSLYFGEWGGTNSLPGVASCSHSHVGLVSLAMSRWQCLPIGTVILISNSPCDVILAPLLLWPGPLVSDLK
jgi:hypothetical protein